MLFDMLVRKRCCRMATKIPSSRCGSAPPSGGVSISLPPLNVYWPHDLLFPQNEAAVTLGPVWAALFSSPAAPALLERELPHCRRASLNPWRKSGHRFWHPAGQPSELDLDSSLPHRVTAITWLLLQVTMFWDDWWYSKSNWKTGLMLKSQWLLDSLHPVISQKSTFSIDIRGLIFCTCSEATVSRCLGRAQESESLCHYMYSPLFPAFFHVSIWDFAMYLIVQIFSSTRAGIFFF